MTQRYVHQPKSTHVRSVLGRQFIRHRWARSSSQRARQKMNYGSYGVNYRENKRWNSGIYRARRG